MSNDRYVEMAALVRVVESGSFAAAAREMDLTASALSKTITRLERRLGVRLINRTSRSLALTTEGETFLAGARRALEAVADAEDEVRVAGQRPRGKIRLYSLPSFGYRLVPLIAEFLSLYPEIVIDMQLGSDRLDQVKYGFDIAIRLGQLEDSGALYRHLCDTEWVICASPQYLERHGCPHTPDDLTAHNCLNFSVHTHLVSWQFQPGSAQAAHGLRGNVLSNQAELLRLFALQGVGIIRVSDHVVAEDLARGELVTLLNEYLPKRRDPVWAVYRGREHQSARTRIFLDFLVKRLAERSVAGKH
ncbi:MAG: LysR family transcriptional regulator [Burkholderiales bacterium]|nr:LysR family transcriptional regulator [Burkholderiales bacterium]